MSNFYPNHNINPIVMIFNKLDLFAKSHAMAFSINPDNGYYRIALGEYGYMIESFTEEAFYDAYLTLTASVTVDIHKAQGLKELLNG